jgi:4'-phosphopantetheinyl transferase
MLKIYINNNIWDFDLAAALNSISEQRREQALRFKHEEGQRLCVAAYLLLKRALAELFGIDENPFFIYNEHGKPSIEGRPGIFFNLSHCREAAVCAVSDQPVGIDVETIRQQSESLWRYTLNDDELNEVKHSAQPHVTFTRLWTMKEATLKLCGTGITNNIRHAIDKEKFRYTVVQQPRYIYTVAHAIHTSIPRPASTGR